MIHLIPDGLDLDSPALLARVTERLQLSSLRPVLSKTLLWGKKFVPRAAGNRVMLRHDDFFASGTAFGRWTNWCRQLRKAAMRAKKTA